MGSVLSGLNLRGYLGWDGLGVRRDERKRAWSGAGVKARRDGVKCEAVAKRTGAPCQCTPIRGGRFCVKHARGRDRIDAEIALTQAHRRTLEIGSIPIREERARLGLARIAAQQLQRMWGFGRRGNALFPGQTLILDDYFEERIRAWLKKECGVDLDAGVDAASGREYTPRFIDRVRHGAWRVFKRRNSPDPEFEQLICGRIAKMIISERGWWERYDAIGDNSGADGAS